MRKYKVIFDVDTGVDDATCLIAALSDPKIDAKLITVVDGNVPVENATNHTLYVLDLLQKNIPVVPGILLKKRTDKEAIAAQKRAQEMHGVQNLGGAIVPKQTKHQPTITDVADAMYNVIKDNPHEITIIACAPQSNIAYLLDKYPDAKNLIKQIIFMGGSFGVPDNPNHISYNAGANPIAFDKVIHSGIPCVMVQSLIGRTFARFTEAQVNQVAKFGSCGKFIAETFSVYWEKGYKEKFVANNDVCAYLYLTSKNHFKTQNVDIFVNQTDYPGKLSKMPNKKSKIKLITSLNNKWFVKTMFKKINAVTNFDY